MTRSLSSQESKLILSLEWEKQPFLTIQQAKEILSVSDDHARVILHRLFKKGWLAPVVPGVFELIPAERGEAAFVDTNPLALGSVLVDPYAFAYSTAAYFYGLTTQAPTTVYLQTNTGKTHTITARGKSYRIIYVPIPLFFGIDNVDAYGTTVKMTEPEKTVLDSIFKPATAGDIPEIVAMLWQGKNKLDLQKLVDYSLKYDSQSLVQRLGFLLDYLKIEIPIAERARLLRNVNKNVCYLGRPGKWGKGGKHNATWQVIENIPETEIQAEIKIG
jgi:predicted transcriptional regulator of viral defense system